jgi:hypothetical protein
MNIYRLSSLAGYKTDLPFSACALDSMLLNQPTGEELFTIANVAQFSIQIRKIGVIYTLDKWIEKKTKLSPLAAVVKEIVENGSRLYDLETYEKIAIAKLIDGKYSVLERFFEDRKYKTDCTWVKNWLIFIFETTLATAFQEQKANCCVLDNGTGKYLQYISYYRHNTTMQAVMETTVVADAVQLYFIRRTVY